MTIWFDHFDSADVAWLIVATVGTLVLVWPGYILLYSGWPNRHNPTESSGRWMVLLAWLSIVWVGWVYSLAYAPSYGTMPEMPGEPSIVRNTFQEVMEDAENVEDTSDDWGRGGLIGGGEYLLLHGLAPRAGFPHSLFLARRATPHVPHTVFAMLQLAVFVAAAAPLVVVVRRSLMWRGVLVFIVIWGSVVYAPLVHWLWGDGWLREYGALDGSGGLVHVGIGFSAITCAILLPKSKRSMTSVDAMAMTLGAALVWGGAILLYGALTFQADGRAATATFNSHLAAATGVVGWIATAWFTQSPVPRPPSVLGGVAALAAIAPGCSMILPESSLIVGLIAGIIGCLAYSRLASEGSLASGGAVFALQGLTGAAGTLLTGVFATSSMAGVDRHGHAVDGLAAGDVTRVIQQGVAIAAVAALAMFGSALVLTIVRFTCGTLPVSEHSE